jgi:hypothetical protein
MRTSSHVPLDVNESEFLDFDCSTKLVYCAQIVASPMDDKNLI